MNKRQIQRFKNLIRATEEADNFNMAYYGRCTTPGCVLGNYAARRDLQKSMKLQNNLVTKISTSNRIDHVVSLQSLWLLQHFGITFTEAQRLFSPMGCDFAGRSKSAAVKYLKDFLKNKTGTEVTA